MKRKPPDQINDQEWLNTYADMVTLLLTFFVLLFSMSSVDSAKLQALVMAFQERGGVAPVVLSTTEGGGASGDNPEESLSAGPSESEANPEEMPQDFDQLYEYLKEFVEQEGLQDSVQITKEDNQVFIRFNNNIFFDADSDFLRNDGKAILDYMGAGFKSVEDQILIIRVNGHTAAVPNIPDYHVNDRSLSSNRANNVVFYLEDVKKMSSQKLLGTGYGKNYPIADNETPEGREKNRRVDMMVLSSEVGVGLEGEQKTTQELYDLLAGNMSLNMVDPVEREAEVEIPNETEGPTTPEAPDAQAAVT